jgi:hypothetical protein
MGNFDTKTILMGIIGSLTAFMFYGRIQDASNIQTLQEKVEQGSGERADLWGKYNNDIEKKFEMYEKMADFMIKDANQKSEIKESVLNLKIEVLERELNK